MDDQETIKFEESLRIILDTIYPDDSAPELMVVYERMKEVIEYNVLGGKQTRGMIVVMAFKMFKSHMQEIVTKEDMKTALVLGWCLEMSQAFAIIMDDIMDQSITRRNQLCWFRKVGMSEAILDARILEQEVFRILKKFIYNKHLFAKILDSIHEVMKLTAHGQLLDLLTTPPNQKPDLLSYTESRLKTIYKYKTSYYTFVLPIRFAMYLSNLDPAHLSKMEPILLKIGHLFQMQDDYLDWLGDPKLTGKIGTDIEDGKCCWPVVTALELCNEAQKQVIHDNYGIKSEQCVNAVKQIYNEICLIDNYRDSESELFRQICYQIKEYEIEHKMIAGIMTFILSKIKKRNR